MQMLAFTKPKAIPFSYHRVGSTTTTSSIATPPYDRLVQRPCLTKAPSDIIAAC